MKPWEETWRCEEDDVLGPWGARDDRILFTGIPSQRESHDRARLAAAAPEMAQLLLEAQWASGTSWGPSGDDCEHRDAECYFCEGRGKHVDDCRLVAVLQKAGVISKMLASSEFNK